VQACLQLLAIALVSNASMQSADELLIKISIWSKALKQNKVLQKWYSNLLNSGEKFLVKVIYCLLHSEHCQLSKSSQTYSPIQHTLFLNQTSTPFHSSPSVYSVTCPTVFTEFWQRFGMKCNNLKFHAVVCYVAYQYCTRMITAAATEKQHQMCSQQYPLRYSDEYSSSKLLVSGSPMRGLYIWTVLTVDIWP